MEVKRRVGLPRTTLHVMNRGARKVAIYADDIDRGRFVHLLSRFIQKYEVSLHAWALMPNHYHLQSTSTGDQLWPMMRDLESTYARGFNQRHGTSACLFQGVFKSTWIGDDPRGMAYVSRYIHCNSLQLGIRPENYVWSSCRNYVGKVPVPAWLDPEPVLRAVSKIGEDPNAAYARYLKEAPPRRRKEREAAGEEVGDFQIEYLQHIEARCLERLTLQPDSLKRVPVRTLVCWAAIRIYRFPTPIVAEYYGYANPASVRVALSRFESGPLQDPSVAAALKTFSNISKPRC